MNKYITPVLRYPGGKTRALFQIIPNFPNKIDEYREPFVGGGSVFIRAKQLLGNDISYTINDLNPDLISFWKKLQSNPEDLTEFICDTKQHFEVGRDLYQYCISLSDSANNLEKAARFFILNRITFSGLGDSGGYSEQAYKTRFTDSIINKLQPLSDLIQDVTITLGDYSPHLISRGENVFIFLDPPYFIARNSKLYGKNGDLHMMFDHMKFAECLKRCEHNWLMTCESSEEMKKLFDFSKRTIEWNLNYGMTNVNKRNVKKGCELLMSNYV